MKERKYIAMLIRSEHSLSMIKDPDHLSQRTLSMEGVGDSILKLSIKCDNFDRYYVHLECLFPFC